MKNRIKTASGIVCLVLAFILVLFLGIPTTGEKKITFESTYKDRNVTLEASYYDSENAEYAVLICPGYSCDRQKWRPLSNLFAANGMSVMTFDYSGQGASSSTIGFDNAKIDDISKEISDAVEKLHEISGIDYDKIILVGHSMGGRALLRLLYDYNDPDAVTEVEKREIKNIILLSPEVNYNYNAQASLFAGTSDADEEPWKSYNETLTDGCDIYLIGSTADDIVSEGDIYGIYEHLGGDGAPESGIWSGVTTNSVGSRISVDVISGVLHSYMMYSAKCASLVNKAVENITGSVSSFNPITIYSVYASWILSLTGLYLVLSSLTVKKGTNKSDCVPALIDEKKYLIHKALMWLPGVAAAFIVCSLCVIMPFGSPVMNIPYSSTIAGYGLVMLLAYRKGKFAGTDGKLPHISFKVKSDRKNIAKTAAAILVLLFFVWYILFGTMYRLIPFNYRLFWAFFLSVLMTVGYYVAGCENDMLKESGACRRTIVIYNLIQYIALFLLITFYFVIKSYSGVIGQAQNMFFMYIFSIPLGDYIRQKTGNRLFGAIASAFTFQAFMITSAALISFF